MLNKISRASLQDFPLTRSTTNLHFLGVTFNVKALAFASVTKGFLTSSFTGSAFLAFFVSLTSLTSVTSVFSGVTFLALGFLVFLTSATSSVVSTLALAVFFLVSVAVN